MGRVYYVGFSPKGEVGATFAGSENQAALFKIAMEVVGMTVKEVDQEEHDRYAEEDDYL